MSSAVVLAIALAGSLLEGTSVWLFVAAISEIAGQGHPSRIGLALVLLAAWMTSRILTAARVELRRRRQILVGVGLVLAGTAATVQAGLMLPAEFVFGNHQPDYRAAGIVTFITIAYLWARGLWLAIHVTRRRLINHLVATVSGLVLILLFLPLSDVVRDQALGAVISTFIIAIAALIMVQLTEAESHQLTRAQWMGVAAATGVLLSAGAALLTGAFSSGSLEVVGRTAAALGKATSPVTDAILIGLGYVAQGLVMFIRWLSDLAGIDGEAVIRAMRGANQSRPLFDDLPPDQGPPDVLAVPVGAFITFLVITIIVLVFSRMVRVSPQREGAGLARRDRIDAPRQGMADTLRRALYGLLGLGDSDGLGASDNRAAIRRMYRTFQQLAAGASMPRALSQTPAEFEAYVAQEIPATKSELESLTEAYAAARYADDRTPLASPRDVARSLEAIRDALQATNRT